MSVRVPHPPIEPPQTRVRFPNAEHAPAHGVLAVGCDFTPGTLLRAYRNGIFPWPHGDDEDERGAPLVLWFSPEPRCIFPLGDEPHWSRSLRRTLRIHPYEVTVDHDFAGVMRLCGETRANATWIIPELARGYEELHRLGWTHSVEVWEKIGNRRELVGGIYGVAIGGLFAGESMFHTRTDASKIAFATLVEKLRSAGYVLFDVQVTNPHLASLGCIEIARHEYLERLDEALMVAPRPLVCVARYRRRQARIRPVSTSHRGTPAPELACQRGAIYMVRTPKPLKLLSNIRGTPPPRRDRTSSHVGGERSDFGPILSDVPDFIGTRIRAKRCACAGRREHWGRWIPRRVENDAPQRPRGTFDGSLPGWSVFAPPQFSFRSLSAFRSLSDQTRSPNVA